MSALFVECSANLTRSTECNSAGGGGFFYRQANREPRSERRAHQGETTSGGSRCCLPSDKPRIACVAVDAFLVFPVVKACALMFHGKLVRSPGAIRACALPPYQTPL